MTVEERMQPATVFKPEIASLNMGSMNFGLYPMLNRFTEFKHGWEREHLENSKDLVFKNTFADIETILKIGNDNGSRFEFECYDISHLYNLAHFVDRGLAKTPLFIQSVLGLLGGIGAHPEDLMHMKRTADRLFGNDYQWSILGAGVTRFHWHQWALHRAAMFVLVWKIHYGLHRVNSQNRMPTRFRKYAR